MNDGNKYIRPLTINVPPDVEYFLKECDDDGLDLTEIVDAILNDRIEISIGGINAVIVYESVTHLD
jgi:hypothetical protein